MSALTFTLRRRLDQRIDLSALTADRLAGLGTAQISALPVFLGNRRQTIGEVFDVSGDDAENIVIAGSGPLDRIGQGMTRGVIRVEGDGGAYLGQGMRGGELIAKGSVGILAACGMRGGSLLVEGNAGDFLGGALPGEMRGMCGGLVRVLGNAGDRVGDRMRRGAILVAGDVGACCGSRMIAGTVAVFGSVGERAGFGMTRGTLLCLRAPSEMLATFNECGSFDLVFLSLLFKQWSGLGKPFDQLLGRAPCARRFMGDLGAAGKGEILVLA